MTFFETFAAVFIATVMGQVTVWWFKKEIEHRLDKSYDHIKGVFKKNTDGGNMKKLRLNIELTSNDKYLVDEIVREGNIMNRPEVETSTFSNIAELGKWIESRLKR